jgi:hypothetical protein
MRCGAVTATDGSVTEGGGKVIVAPVNCGFTAARRGW